MFAILVAGAVKATAFLVITVIAALLLRRRSAGVRHIVWSMGLTAALVAPLLPPYDQGPAPSTVASRDIDLPFPKEFGQPAGESPFSREMSPELSGSTIPSDSLAGSEKTSSITNHDAGVHRDDRPPANDFPVTQTTILLLWASGAGLVILWMIAGQIGLARLTMTGQPVDGDQWASIVASARSAIGCHRSVRILESRRVASACTARLFRPVILVSLDASGWPSSRKRATLAHELAHIKRWDALWSLIGRLSCALHWYNPLIWAAVRESRFIRERACDDVVLAAGTSPSEYVDHLMVSAKAATRWGLVGSAAHLMARPSRLADRLVAILDPTTRRDPGTSRGFAVAAVCGLVAAIPMAPIARVTLPWTAAIPIHASDPDQTTLSTPPKQAPASPAPDSSATSGDGNSTTPSARPSARPLRRQQPIAADWTVDPSPILVIKARLGTERFKRVNGATQLPDRNILVADQVSPAAGEFGFYLYSPSGQLLRRLVRQGDRPGEVTDLAYFLRCGDTLVVLDRWPARASFFSLNGEFVRDFRFAVSGVIANDSGPHLANHHPYTTACGPTGWFAHHSWGQWKLPAGPDSTGLNRDRAFRAPATYWLSRGESAVAAVLGVFPGSERWGTVEENLLLGKSPLALGRQPSLAVGTTRVYLGTAESNEVLVFDYAGKRLPSVTWRARPIERTADDVDNHFIMQRATIRPMYAKHGPDSVTQFDQHLRTELAKMDFPETLPPYSALIVDGSDNLWVGSHPRLGQPTLWRVFDSSGNQLVTVSVPANFEVYEIGEDYLLGRYFDYERWRAEVRLYRLRRG